MKIHFTVYSDGSCTVSNLETLEADREDMPDDDIMLHAVHESEHEDDAGLDALIAVHYLGLNGDLGSSVEKLATTLVRAGMELQRQKTLEKVKTFLEVE